MDELHLVDIWRNKNMNAREYTWSQSSPMVACRLDMWLIPLQMTQLVKSVKIETSIQSDHKMISLEIASEQEELRGPGYWKLNTSVLKEKQYQEMIRKTIKELREEPEQRDIDPRYQWEEIKYVIRQKSMDYCKKRATQRKAKEKKIQTRLQALEKELHELNSDVVEEYCDLKKEFEELYDEKAKGAILRSRTKWIAQGERNTKYFYGLEKRNSTHQSIVQLQTDDNDLIESTKDILDEIHKFFSNLYSTSYKTNVDHIEEYGCFFENLPQISEAESEELGKEITMDECEVAMRQMADNKSPGDDGLPVEFYKLFWPELKEMLFTTYKQGKKLSLV